MSHIIDAIDALESWSSLGRTFSDSAILMNANNERVHGEQRKHYLREIAEARALQLQYYKEAFQAVMIIIPINFDDAPDTFVETPYIFMLNYDRANIAMQSFVDKVFPYLINLEKVKIMDLRYLKIADGRFLNMTELQFIPLNLCPPNLHIVIIDNFIKIDAFSENFCQHMIQLEILDYTNSPDEQKRLRKFQGDLIETFVIDTFVLYHEDDPQKLFENIMQIFPHLQSLEINKVTTWGYEYFTDKILTRLLLPEDILSTWSPERRATAYANAFIEYVKNKFIELPTDPNILVKSANKN